MSNWTLAVRALRSRNYRLFFSGQSVSLVGTWMTRVATGWLVYRLTGSAVLLGTVSFAGQAPSFFLAPFAGVLVDRWDRQRTLLVTQALSMLQSLSLGLLTLSGRIEVWHIVALATVQGIVSAFDMPARQSFVVEMVERREDLGNAIALNSSMVNAARLIGPATAGLLITAVGEAWCFIVDGVSYLAVIASLLLMRVIRGAPLQSRGSVTRQFREGWSYVSGSVPIRSILLLLGIVSFAGMPYTVLMPVIVSDVLHGGPDTLGLLMAASGLGALGGALTLAMRRTVLGLGRRIVLCSALFGLGVAAFGASPYIWLSMLILPLIGFSMMQQMAASNTILQTIVDDQKRGRVMAFYAMAFQGMAPFGSMSAGMLASQVGTRWTLALSGVVCVAGSLWFARRLPEIRTILRPVYIRLGILQATTLQTPEAS